MQQPKRTDKWFLFYLAVGYAAFAEILSWETSKFPSCIVISEYQPADYRPGYETCATLHEGVMRVLAFVWDHATHDNISAAAAVVIAIFTWTLWRSTERLWQSADKQFTHAKQKEFQAFLDKASDNNRLREQIQISQQTADAATLSAKALIDAERAHLYVIIKNETVKSTFQSGVMYDNSPSMEDSPMTGPGIQYVFQNFGKSPAILVQVMHGMIVERVDSTRRASVLADGALEVIGVNGISPANTITYGETNAAPFKFGDARALVTEQAMFFFYGEAIYTDAFGGRVTLEWEFLADGGALRQTKHREEREAFPDEKPDAPFPPERKNAG